MKKTWDGTSYNMVYAVRAYALTQIVSLRSATSHIPKTLSAMPCPKIKKCEPSVVAFKKLNWIIQWEMSHDTNFFDSDTDNAFAAHICALSCIVLDEK